MSGDRAERFSRLSIIVTDAPRTDDAEALSQWLDTACGGDEWLRTQAAELLEHRRDVPSEFLAAPGEAVTPLPDRIGPFTVTGRLGQGGMGEVFVGHDPEAGRDVAIKVVIGGAAGKEVLARFEAERRMLARMDHPGIARVWSVGRTEEQQPWLSMELIPDAVDVVTHAERERLALRDRVRLMADVCDAVHHAHQKSVVHRDIKPGNIVVSATDPGRPPRPRVIDFGVARLVDEAALLDFRTRAGQLIGTKAYMAPEQAGDPAAADVRSDIFALGTVLYELVTGRRAFSSAGGPPATPPIDVDGPFAVPPDLDLIVRTAIAEDPVQRYGSAEALAADLRRLLANEPITARRPTATYVVRKFVRRHRPAVAISVAAAIALVITAVLATGQAIRATRAEAATQRFAYRAGLVAAASAIRERDAVAAAAFLDALPEGSRDWEWSLLDRRARGYARRLGRFDIYAEAIALDEDDRIIVQPTIARAFGATDPPQRRGELLVVGGAGLSVVGRRAVTWGDREIRVTDTATDQSLEVVPTSFAVVAATVDGPTLLALGEDAILRRRDSGASAWTELGPRMPAPASRSVSTRLHPLEDGSLLVSWPDGFVVADEERILREVRFSGPPSAVSPAISRDGALIASCRGDRRILVHEVTTGSPIHEIADLPADGVRIAFDRPAERLFIADRDGALHLVHLADGLIVGPPRLGHSGLVTALVSTPDDRVLSADFGGSVLEWDVGPAASVPRVLVHTGPVGSVSVAADGIVGTLTRSDGLRRWRPGSLAPEPAEPEAIDGWVMSELPGGRLAWCHADGTLMVRRDEGVAEITVFEGATVTDLEASPDGTRLAISHDLEGIAVVTHATGTIERFEGVTGAWSLTWIDETSILVAETPLGVSRLDTGTGVRRVLSPDLQPNSLARLDGRRALVGTFDGALVELDLETGATLRRIDGHGWAVSAISISPDGRRVASGDQGGTISVRDAADGQELLRLPGTERGAVLSLAWSPDGSALVAGHSRPWAAIWAVGPPWAPARSAGEDS